MASIHTAPRIIRVGRVYAHPHTPSSSLVAGCISAIWMSRIFVCSFRAEVHAESPLRSRNFYDDITSRVSGRGGDIEAPLADHGAAVARALAKARITHNTKKTVVTASRAHLGNKVIKLLKRRNVTLKVVRGARDLGLDAGGGLRQVVTCPFACPPLKSTPPSSASDSAASLIARQQCELSTENFQQDITSLSKISEKSMHAVDTLEARCVELESKFAGFVKEGGGSTRGGG